MRRNKGFTLIELTIVVAVIGILAAIAMPAYTKWVMKGKRAEGRTALLDLLQQQERYMTQHNAYLAFSAGQSGVPFKTFSGSSATNASYLLAAQACSGTTIAECVQLTAVPQRPDPDVDTISITSTGQKTCTGTSQADCWR
ncbi:type IV pilin protein [Noviherbaspirillum sp. DKR-6]|uniref:Type IV pilin protein n=2 Tax=Noviherbaspirillum pedocola TaxID=2801341 RepID=A0A934SZQ9_9BURK|nr:type IV pilin protein [Noviherbaspirillum pedocola]